MTRLTTMQALNDEEVRQNSLETTVYSMPLSSAPKATWAYILGVMLGLLLFAPRAASREGCTSHMTAPSFPPLQCTTALPEPQSALNEPQGDAPQLSGSIAGTIIDPSGAPILGAVVKLTSEGQSSLTQAESDEDGRFVFLAVPPGGFQLTISAQGFRTQEFTGTVHADERYLTPQITLSLAENTTQITVTPETQEEIAEKQIKAQEKQRVFGFLPNFYVSYVPDAAPLSFKQKMKLALRTSEDPITISSVGAAAEIE